MSTFAAAKAVTLHGVGLFIIGGAMSTSSLAADRLVPSQYSTIQAAVNASTHGDRVVVSPGLYRESVRFLGKSILLEGASEAVAEQVVIACNGVAGPSVFIADSTSYVGVVGIRNLTITSEGVLETGQDAGATFSYLGPNATAVVDHCIFRDNKGGGTYGALYLGHPNCSVRNCKFLRNQTPVHGAAIYAYDNVAPIVENCVFVDHTLGTGTFYARVGTNLTVRNCVVRNSNTLTAHFQTGIVTMSDNIGCQIGSISNGGYVEGGGNDWDGPCPDCDSDGILDLDEMLFYGGDCNTNGVLDSCEIPSHPEWDVNHDGILDECQCLADISGNGVVDAVDIAALMNAWLSTDGGKTGTDIDGDGIVSGTDLTILLSSWGPCP